MFRCSVCTGDKVARFRDKESGKFTDVMVIRSTEEEQRFKTIDWLENIKNEYYYSENEQQEKRFENLLPFYPRVLKIPDLKKSA